LTEYRCFSRARGPGQYEPFHSVSLPLRPAFTFTKCQPRLTSVPIATKLEVFRLDTRQH
jgi:hypothetical protein